jgi:hypothetical protein
MIIVEMVRFFVVAHIVSVLFLYLCLFQDFLGTAAEDEISEIGCHFESFFSLLLAQGEPKGKQGKQWSRQN